MLTADKKKKLKNVALIAVTLVVLALLILYIIRNREAFLVVLTIPASTVIICALLSFLALTTNASYYFFAAKSLDIRLDVVDWLGVSACAGTVGFVIPMRSEYFIKGIYYKAKCGLSYGRFISVTAAGLLLVGFSVLIQCIAGLLLLGLRDSFSIQFLLYATAILIVAVLAFLLLVKKQAFVRGILPFKKYLLPAYDGFIALLGDRNTVACCFSSVCASAALNALIMFLLARSVQIPTSFGAVLIYWGVLSLSNYLSILPGNIGLQEMLLGWMITITNGAFESGVLLALLFRAFTVLRYFTFAAIFAIPVITRLRAANRSQKAAEEAASNPPEDAPA